MWTTRPNISIASPSVISWTDTHSRCALVCPILGGATFTEGTGVSPLHSNSSSSGGKAVAVKTMSSMTSIVTILSTNSPVARMFRTESLTPVELTMTCGGSTDTPLKKACGAILRKPSGDKLEIQAIGLGMTRDVNKW